MLDKQNQDFMKHANPWALRGIIEKLNEAADRGLWAEPDPELMAAMQQVYLDVEGDLEDVPAGEASTRMISDRGVLDFLTERHLATLTTLRRDGRRTSCRSVSPTSRPTRIARVITSRRLGQGPQRRPRRGRRALCQVDRARWLTLSRPGAGRHRSRSGRRRRTPYAERYRQPRVNPKRVVLIMTVTSVSASVRLG